MRSGRRDKEGEEIAGKRKRGTKMEIEDRNRERGRKI